MRIRRVDVARPKASWLAAHAVEDFGLHSVPTTNAAFYRKRNRAVRSVPSPRSRRRVRQLPAQARSVFQLNW